MRQPQTVQHNHKYRGNIMSIISTISADLSAVKKLSSVAHLGNGISIDAAKSALSSKLAGLTGGLKSQIAGATSGLTSQIAGATGSLTKGISAVKGVSGAGLSSGVLPAPINVGKITGGL